MLDSVVSLAWIGGLALLLVSKAVLAWLRFRYAARSALHARHLAESTKRISAPTAQRGVADIVPFRKRSPRFPAGTEPGA